MLCAFTAVHMMSWEKVRTLVSSTEDCILILESELGARHYLNHNKNTYTFLYLQ